MFSLAASASHLPDALIHSTPSSFMEMFPVLAWVSSGLRPTRAARFQQRAKLVVHGTFCAHCSVPF